MTTIYATLAASISCSSARNTPPASESMRPICVNALERCAFSLSRPAGGLHSLGLFFFSSRGRHTGYWRDWSSGVCSSDLSPLRISSRPCGRCDLASQLQSRPGTLPAVRAFVTGGTGFIGAHLVRKLRARGDEVVALVRSPGKAAPLREQGCEIVEGGLENVDAIRRGLDGCDACFHGAAIYTVGIPKSEHEQMYETNVRGTERVLDAAIEAEAPRIVYLSTIAVFGNTHGQILDETKHPEDRREFTSWYDET